MIKTLKIGKKSQIVLPVSIRKRLRISEGDEIIIHSTGNKIVIVVGRSWFLNFNLINPFRDSINQSFIKISIKALELCL